MQLSSAFLALYALNGAAAFSMGGIRAKTNVVAPMMSGWDMKEITPDGSLAQRVEGKTRKTWKFNDLSKEHVQVAVTSEGRPLHPAIQFSPFEQL